MLSAVLYARIRTGDQAAWKQLRAMRAYAVAQEWVVLEEYVDIVTGAGDACPSWDQLFRDALDGRFGVVLFWSLEGFVGVGSSFAFGKLDELVLAGVSWVSHEDAYSPCLGAWGVLVSPIDRMTIR